MWTSSVLINLHFVHSEERQSHRSKVPCEGMDTYEELTLFGDEFLISEPLDTTNAGSSSAEVSPYSPVFADEFVISRPLDTTNAGLSSAEVSPYSNDTLSEYASPESNSSIDWDFAPESDSSLVFDDPCIDEIPRTSAEVKSYKSVYLKCRRLQLTTSLGK